MTLATIHGLVDLAGLSVLAAICLRNLAAFRLAPPAPADPPPLSILIPARDEAASIERAVRAACAQTATAVEVVALDDGSADDTPRILARLSSELPRLRVVSGEPMPPGWAGKAWACWQLASRHARHGWLLFVDADVRLRPDAAARALAAARAAGAEFVSAFPRQVLGSAAEALIVPLIYLVLLMYLPVWLVRRHPMPALSAGCGQFMLVRRDAYLAAGGHRAVRGTLHDGLMLARRMKAAGFAVGLFDGRDVACCRMYSGLRATWQGFARNAYEALGSFPVLTVMVVSNGAFFVLPSVVGPLLLVTGGLSPAAAAWSGSLALALGVRAALAARFGAPWWTVPATPVAVLLMIGIQLNSYLNARTGRSVVWRARVYRGPPGREGQG
jgi:hypothetical protein